MRNAAVNFKNYIMRKEAEALALIYAPKFKKQGSAIVAEIILIVVVIALAVAYKAGALTYLNDLWTFVTTSTKSALN
ncbi:MAG TPA: hypothetical protein DCY19_08030 [Eubacterium sp.]|nr:hypothetical protein [Eubacterium sp.]